MKKLILFLLISVLSLTLITPSNAYAATVKINKSKVTLNVGKTYTLKISGTTKAVKWTSSKKSVATVSSKGKVTALKAGTAVITATVNKKSYRCSVTVKDPVVKVFLPVILLGDMTIEEYVDNVKESSDYLSVKKYDNEYIEVTMKESYRLKQIKEFNKSIEAFITSYLTDPNYSKIFVDVKYNKSFSKIKLYAIGDAFIGFNDFSSLPSLAYLSDFYQALQLIDIKDRTFTLDVIDQDTDEIIFSYN